MLTLWNVSKIYRFQFLNKTDKRERGRESKSGMRKGHCYKSYKCCHAYIMNNFIKIQY